MKVIEGKIWYQIKCPECEVTNFIYSGYFPDPDSSKMDVDGFKCWNCKKEHIYYEDEDRDPEEALYYKDGQRQILKRFLMQDGPDIDKT